MIAAVLSRLTADSALATLLGASPTDTRIYPHSIDGFEAGVAYEFHHLSRGPVNQSRVEFRVQATTVSDAVNIEERLLELLEIPENEPGFLYDGVNVLSMSLNGGGSMEFEGMDLFQRFLYFDVKWR